MTGTNRDLEARILADLDELDAYVVYGDWLSERGDPRGELVSIQISLERSANDDLYAREAALLAEHAHRWLGDLAGRDNITCRWRRGFLSTIQLAQHRPEQLALADAIRALMALPDISFIHTLDIGAKRPLMETSPWRGDPLYWDDAIEAIAIHGVPAGLHSLRLHRGHWDISSTDLGDLSPAYPRLARLRELYIEMGGMELGIIELPALRSLSLITGALSKSNLTSLGLADMPMLERLSLCIGETGGDYGGNVTIDDLGFIFAAENLARLRHLGLTNSGFTDAIAAALSTSKVLAQLETLDLSLGTLGETGAQLILDHADAFAHLERLDLSNAFIGPAMRDRLAALGPKVILDDLADPDEPRYVQIGE